MESVSPRSLKIIYDGDKSNLHHKIPVKAYPQTFNISPIKK